MFSVLDLFFPTTVIELQNLSQPFFKKPLGDELETIFVATSLANDNIHKLVEKIKTDNEFVYASQLSRVLETPILSDFMPILTSHLDPSKTLISFVPADPQRQSERGFHLPQILAQSLAQNLGIKIQPLLSKPNSTIRQTYLNRSQRLQNLNQKFVLNNNLTPNISNFDNLWLVDDVTTTGSTLWESAKAIKSVYPFLKIYGVVVASN